MITSASANARIATAFFSALAGEDDQSVRDLCDPRIRPSQNGGPALDLDGLLTFAKRVHAVTDNFEYGDPLVSASETGFVQEHIIRGTLADGQPVRVPTCVVAEVHDGRITALREYFDSAAGTALLGALAQ